MDAIPTVANPADKPMISDWFEDCWSEVFALEDVAGDFELGLGVGLEIGLLGLGASEVPNFSAVRLTQLIFGPPKSNI